MQKPNRTPLILIPFFESYEDSLEYIKPMYAKIFEIELDSWSADKRTWPQKRDYSLFAEWFDVEIHSEVLDSVDNDIEKDEY